MQYYHLSTEARYQIFAQKAMGKTISEIAKSLGRSVSTISRELRRNRDEKGTYRAEIAVAKAAQRAKKSAKNAKQVSEKTWKFAILKLKEKWSPEQISAYLKTENGRKLGLSEISPETIYQKILQDKAQNGDLYRHLRCQKKRKKRYGTPENRGKLQNRVGIEDRPEIVEKRSRTGDWEADLVLGKEQQGALLTLVERKTGFTLIAPLLSKSAHGVKNAMFNLLKKYQKYCHTITSDNGMEFSQHAEIAQQLSAKFYFARPYHSWERGTNENTNGLIRQYFPKNRTLLTVTQKEIQFVTNQLNHRPRKRLKYLTPSQAFALRHAECLN